MGLFSFVGKAVGGLAKVVGGVAKVGIGLGVGALKSGLLPIPFGGKFGALAGALLRSKAPGGHSQLKLQIPPLVVRGKTLRPVVKIGMESRPTLTALRRSPVMPGGAIATRTGVASRPLSGAAPIGTTGGGTKRRRRKAGASTRRKSRSSYGKKRTRRRRLKFGSPAWRKKYLGHGRKRRKRRRSSSRR